MLAYVFWHRPREGVDRGAYEVALIAFHEALKREALDGFHGSHAFAVAPLPWLEGDGYEDWYLVEAAFALDSLNAGAVSGAMEEPHRSVAALTGPMAAGLYRLVNGDGCDGTVATWSAFRQTGGFSVWQRQMVLGPTPEFCLLGDRGAEGVLLERRRVF